MNDVLAQIKNAQEMLSLINGDGRHKKITNNFIEKKIKEDIDIRSLLIAMDNSGQNDIDFKYINNDMEIAVNISLKRKKKEITI